MFELIDRWLHSTYPNGVVQMTHDTPDNKIYYCKSNPDTKQSTDYFINLTNGGYHIKIVERTSHARKPTITKKQVLKILAGESDMYLKKREAAVMYFGPDELPSIRLNGISRYLLSPMNVHRFHNHIGKEFLRELIIYAYPQAQWWYDLMSHGKNADYQHYTELKILRKCSNLQMYLNKVKSFDESVSHTWFNECSLGDINYALAIATVMRNPTHLLQNLRIALYDRGHSFITQQNEVAHHDFGSYLVEKRTPLTRSEREFNLIHEHEMHIEPEALMVEASQSEKHSHYYNILCDTIKMAASSNQKFTFCLTIPAMERQHNKVMLEFMENAPVIPLTVHQHFSKLAEHLNIPVIDDGSRLKFEGLSMKHCVASRASNVNEGVCGIFHVDDPEKPKGYTMQVNRTGKDFYLSEIRGFANSSVPGELKETLKAKIAEFSEIMLVNETPQELMDRVRNGTFDMAHAGDNDDYPF